MEGFPQQVSLSYLYRKVFSSHESTVSFLQQMGTFPSHKKCPKCEVPMKLVIASGAQKHGIGRFRCQRIAKHADKKEVSIQLAAGTWLERAKLTPQDAILLMYFFGLELTNDQIKHEFSGFRDNGTTLSDETISDYRSLFRDSLKQREEKVEREEGPLGGENVCVQLDESKFGRRKHNRGRLVDGPWMLGMIDEPPVDADKNAFYGMRIEICPDNKRDSATLIPLIQKHVQVGTTITTDQWGAYNELENLGYSHLRVNHSENYVDPETGAHTQRIESCWRPLKYFLIRHSSRHEHLPHLIKEFLWRRRMRYRGDTDHFSSIISAVNDKFADTELSLPERFPEDL